MKGDLACVIQDKLALEERLQKNNEMLKALQANHDNLYGNYEKKERELASLQIERERLIAMADDTRQLLAVMTESKEVATKLVKSHIIRADNLQKELEVLKQELADKNALEQKVMELTAALDRSKDELEF